MPEITESTTAGRRRLRVLGDQIARDLRRPRRRPPQPPSTAARRSQDRA
ncbi:hypothetical protein [Streptomyces sp. BA2]|nr:hypothetical protein [Streptomyces sp. BA2]MWA16089.1 hypothetical protein [Streptomyces sp. BA2]